jgi:hypothetical protein
MRDRRMYPFRINLLKTCSNGLTVAVLHGSMNVNKIILRQNKCVYKDLRDLQKRES